MTNLTKQWKKGELKEYKRYYCKTVWFEDIFMARCHNKGQNDEWWTLENEKYSYNNVRHIKDIEVLAEVPSYEEYTKLKKQLAHVTRTQAKQFRDNQKLQVRAERAKDVVNINTAREIKRLKELLKECREFYQKMYSLNIINSCSLPLYDDLKKRINQVLGEE